MRDKRCLFFILILFLIIFSTSFVSASEDLAHGDTNGKMMLSNDSVAIDNDKLSNVNLDSIDESADSTLGLVDDVKNTNEIENESRLTFNDKAPILGVRNDEPVLAAYDKHLDGGDMNAVRDAILEISANGGGTLYLNGGTYTGMSGILAGTYNEAAGDVFWMSDPANRPNQVYINNVRIYGGYQLGDGVVAQFGDGWDYALTFGVKYSLSPVIPNSGNRRGTYGTDGCFLTNVTFENLNGTKLVNFVSGGLTDCVINNCTTQFQFMGMQGSYWDKTPIPIKNCNFTNCHQTYPGANGVNDGSGQLGAVFGIAMDNCNFINTSSAQHGGALCVADESEWGSGRVTSTIKNTRFENISSRWFAIYIHGNFSTSFAYIDSPEIIENCVFVNCTGTGEFSGAIGISHRDLIVKNSNFTDCSGGQGGAIMVGGISGDHDGFSGRNYAANNVTIEGCIFTNNVAAVDGQTSSFCVAVYNEVSDGKMPEGAQRYSRYGESPNFVYYKDPNGDYYMKHDDAPFYPSGKAGAVYVLGNDTKIIDCIFDKNSASSDGAAIYIEGERTIINGSEFYNHISETGTVYINGNYTKVIDSTFKDNKATDGAGVYIVGHDTTIDDSTFETNEASETGAGVYVMGRDTNIFNTDFESNKAHDGGAVYINGSSSDVTGNKFNKNIVDNQGGALFINGDESWISNNTFTDNEAVPQDNSSSGTTGLGGAIYVDGDHTQSGENTFTHNKARNGSAIYTNGNDFKLYYDTFNENQAWSYLLIITPEPEESYYNQSDVNITVCHVGGDNIINAIHNTASNGQIQFHNVTYKNSHGDVVTTAWGVYPVDGAEASNNGQLLYQDDRENVQLINITKIVRDEDGEVILQQHTDYTNITGEIRYTIRKPIKPGNYTVYAEHPEDWNYKFIASTAKFEVLGLVDLSTNKTSDKNEYNVSDIVVWTIKVHNAANASNATNVTLKDVLPSGFSFINATATKGNYSDATKIWTIGNMTNGTTETLTINSRAINNGTYTNEVNVTCNEKDWNLTNNPSNRTVIVHPICDLVINKTVNASVINLNETVSWTINVTNNGPSVAKNVVVTDTLPDGLELQSTPAGVTVSGNEFTWSIGDMDPYTSKVLTIVTKAVKEGNLTNIVVVTTDTNETNSSNNKANNTTQVDPICDLVISKAVNASVINLNETVSWTINVTNNGPSVAKNVVVTDTLPDGLELQSTPAGVTVSGNEFTWSIGDMDPYTSKVLTIVTKAVKEGNLTNIVVVTTDTNETNSSNNKANNTTQVDPICDLVISKAVNASVINLNETVSWTINVTNNGPSVAKNVVVTDTLPDGLELQSTPAGVTVSGNEFTWSIGDMDPYTSKVLTIVTKAVKEGNLTNIVVVTTDTNETNSSNNKANNTTQVDPICDLVISKAVNASVINLNETVSWTINVTNNGPSVAKNVVVTDTLPDGLVLVNNPGVTVSGNEFTWSIGDMDPYTSKVLTIVTKAVKEGNLTNIVVVTTDTNETNSSNNKANNTTQVDPICDLVISKAVNASVINLNETVSWTINVTNNGPSVAKNVVVTDTLPDGLELQSTPAGVTVSGNEFTWSIGDMDPYTSKVLTIVTKAVKEGNLTNIVVVTTDTNETNSSNNKANNTTQVDPICDLVINKTVNASVINLNESVSWTITVVNNGPSVAENVVVTDTLPAGAIVIGSYAKDVVNGVLILKIGNLDAYSSIVIKIVTRLTTEGNNTNIVVVNTTTNESDYSNNNANNTTFVVSVADLEINKTVSNASVHKGDTVTWTITVKNNGPNTAVNVTVTDVLPKELINPEVINLGHAGKFEGNVWSIDEIASGDYKVLVIRTTVNATNTTIVNVVNVTSDTYDPNETNNNASNETVVPPEADLEVIKLTLNRTAHIGDVVSWVIFVYNHGPDAAVNVTVRDVVPSELVNVTVVHITNGTFENNVWSIDRLESENFSILIINTTVDATNTNVTNVVNVTSDTYDPNETNNVDNDTVEIPPEADLEVFKLTFNRTAHKGDVVSWMIFVYNNGPDAAVNITVRDVVPSELVDVTLVIISRGTFENNVWSIDRLESGTSLLLVLNTTVDATNVNITNVVNVTSDTYDPNMTNNEANDTVEVPPEADLAVTITNNFEESGETCHDGDTIVWTITVTNNGPDTAVNSVLKDVLPDGVVYVSHDNANGTYDEVNAVWTIGDLPVGETVTLTITTVANTTNATVYRNVSVSSDTYDPDLSNNYDNSSVDVPPEADLAVVITNNFEESGETCHDGDTIVWTITVTNNGPDTAVNSILKDVLPDGVVYVSHDNANGTYDEVNAVWTIGDLPVGETVTLTITTLANTTNATVYRNVSVSSDTYDPDLSNNYDNSSLDIPPEADLEVTITNNFEQEGTPAHNGDEVIWTITVTNHGPDDAINTILKDVLPDGLVYVSDDSEGSYDNETAVWTIGDLPVGETVTLTIRTLANATNVTVYRNVSVSSDTYDPDLSNNYDNSSVEIVAQADLEVIKSVSDKAAEIGDIITWTIIVKNNGVDTAVNAVVTDKLPSGVVYVSDDSQGAYDSVTGVWTIGDLASGESVNLTIYTEVVVTNKTIVNPASVTSDTYDPNEENNYCNDSTTVPPKADLEVTTVPDVNIVTVGDEVIWTITVVNHGPDSAVNSRARIVIPDSLRVLGFKPSKGTYDSETGIWTIGDLVPDEKVTLKLETEVLKHGSIDIDAIVESDTYDPNMTNNEEPAGVIPDVPNPDNGTDVPPGSDVPSVKVSHEELPATGNPIVMVLLALLAIVGISLKRKS